MFLGVDVFSLQFIFSLPMLTCRKIFERFCELLDGILFASCLHIFKRFAMASKDHWHYHHQPIEVHSWT